MTPLLRSASWLLRRRATSAWTEFEHSLLDPVAAQDRLLTRLLGESSRSAYGKSKGLDVADLRSAFSRIEPSDYAEFEPYISSDINSGRNSFSPHAVGFYERTSGTGGSTKLIPYNKGLRRAFDEMFSLWAYDLLSNVLRLNSGRAFMSVSPPLLGRRREAHGVIVGTADDTEYVGGATALLLRPFLVVPRSALQLSGAGDFKDVICAAVLAECALEVVSVWSPSFWLVVLDHISHNIDRLAPELLSGKLSRGGLLFRHSPLTRQRLALVVDAVAREDWSKVWPDLQLISCWTEAEAFRPATMLRERFPDVLIQGKGLLATEAPVTIPLFGAPAPVPLLNQVVVELAMPDGSLSGIGQWRDGDEGEVVLTQPGGFLRYRLHDRVVVNGFFHATPCLSFLGRAGRSVDLVGEKLSEDFVRRQLAPLFPNSSFMSLCPVVEHFPPFYALLTDHLATSDDTAIETALAKSSHYRLARALGQLGPVRIVVRPRIAAEWQAILQDAGIRAGNVKEQTLITRSELAAHIWRHLGQGGV